MPQGLEPSNQHIIKSVFYLQEEKGEEAKVISPEDGGNFLCVITQKLVV